MKYLTAAEIAKQWNISSVQIRKYCIQGRIPGAVFKDQMWLIPSDATYPQKAPREKTVAPKIPLPPLAAKLVHQKNGRNYHGLYDYTQINLTYSSCRMASCRLTRDQVSLIFRKGKVGGSFELTKVSDLIEAMNHCVCVDYILDHVMEPLTQKLIKKLHYTLVFGSVDQRMERVRPGEYRLTCAGPRDLDLIDPKKVNTALGDLIKEYEKLGKFDLNTILDFHVRFEQIYPFDDCNGRVGRLILFKECLRHDVMPFILDDKRRGRYLDGLRSWENDRSVLLEVVTEAQSRYEAQIEIQKLLARGKAFEPVGYTDEEEEE